jgi:hypothetical protein
MSPRASTSKKKVKGPPGQPDVYVGLLTMSVVSLLVGIILLWRELDAYEWRLP